VSTDEAHAPLVKQLKCPVGDGRMSYFLHHAIAQNKEKFLARDSIYAIARYMPSPVRPSVRLSVCLSVRHTGGSVKDV